MPPTVSIVLPTFNRLHYLRPAVESVFAQTFGDWELLIADDGSSEPTLAYLRELESSGRVQLLPLAHSGRTSVVRNAALRTARGEYVAFLDSDDLWEATKLEKQIDSLRAHPDRSWSYTGFRMVNASLQPHNRYVRFHPSRGGIVGDVLTFRTTIVQSSVMLYRSFLERTGLYDERLSLCSDLELWLRCALLGEADCVDEPLVWVRRHDEHEGDDVEACQDLNRALELALPALKTRWSTQLRRQRAIASVTLARSQAVHGQRRAALGTLLASAHYAWIERDWWPGAAGAVARALAPTVVRRAARRVLRSRA